MTQFQNRFAIWSLLHEPVLINGSSPGSVFKSPLYRVHNEHESESGSGFLLLGSDLTERLRNTVTRNQIHIIHINTLLHTHMCTCTLHIRVHRYTYVYTHIHTSIYIHITLFIYTLIHTYIHSHPHMHANPLIHIHDYT